MTVHVVLEVVTARVALAAVLADVGPTAQVRRVQLNNTMKGEHLREMKIT